MTEIQYDNDDEEEGIGKELTFIVGTIAGTSSKPMKTKGLPVDLI